MQGGVLGKRSAPELVINASSSFAEVKEWLATILSETQLAQVLDTLEKNGEEMDGEVLLSLTEADLSEGLRINSFCVRRKILLHLGSVQRSSRDFGQNSEHANPMQVQSLLQNGHPAGHLQIPGQLDLGMHDPQLEGQDLHKLLLTMAGFAHKILGSQPLPGVATANRPEAAAQMGPPGTSAPPNLPAFVDPNTAAPVPPSFYLLQNNAASSLRAMGMAANNLERKGRGGPNTPKTCQKCRLAGKGSVPLAGGHECPFKDMNLEDVKEKFATTSVTTGSS